MSFQLILSDNSQSALDLCRFNCQQNGLDDNSESRPSSIQFELLPWGSSLTEDMMGTMDVVFATDVIYDADAWSPLLETAKTSLRRSGHLIVSHVPRAALPVAKPTGGEPKQYHEALESFLVDTATLHGFSLQSTLRPTDLPCFKTQHEEMQQAGAAIFIFQLTTSSP
jgi:predicted nicotinamide N-methyase